MEPKKLFKRLEDHPRGARPLDAVPSLVQIFANQVHMTPIAWRIELEYVVIVFEQGPKMRFSRDDVLAGAIHGSPVISVVSVPSVSKDIADPLPDPKQSPEPIPPKIQKLPVRSSPKGISSPKGKRSKKK